jgi:Viral BACON domain
MISMMIHNRRTAAARQTTSKLLGGAALTFAMLLGLVNLSWALQVSPSTLTFSATSGGTDPSPQTVVLSSSRTRERTWTATENAPWITITPSSGTIATETDTVSVRATAAGLAAGSYSTNVTITETSQGGHIRRTILPVTLSVAGAPAAPAIQLSVSSLTFSGTAGGANPAPNTFSVSNTGGGTLAWTASDTAGWLILSPSSGTDSGTVTATVNLTGLAAGTYNTTASVTASGATAKTIPVTFTLSPAGSATSFSISPSTLAYTATVGSPNNPGSVTVTNTGSSAITVTWADSINWLVAITPGITQTIQPGLSGTFTLTASFANLAAGSYSGTATISGGGVTKQVPVTLALTAATSTPAIGLNTTSLGFAGTVAGTNPSAQTIGVSNVGSGTLSWAASDNAAWLTLSPVSGTNSGTVTANVNLTGLAAGTYNATVTVTASGVTAKSLPVTLTMTATSVGATIGFSPTSLTFTGTVGGTNPAAKPISISNTGGGTLSWTASDNAAWLTLSPVSGSNSGTVTASVNMTGLAAGTYNSIVTITASGSTNTPQQIPVSFTLSATTAGTATLAWNAGTDSDLAGYKVYRGTASGTYGAPLTTLPKTTTNYTVTGLQNGTTYFFVITAYDSAGNESTYSNEVSKSIF